MSSPSAYPLQIGITGGIGSGKSLVCRIFNCLGIPVYDADTQAKELMNTDPILIEQVKKEFGEEAYLKDGSIDRKYIASKVFGNEAKLKILNGLVHPRVKVDYANWKENNRQAPYVIREAALIYEAGVWQDLDKVIVVSAPEEVRMKRVLGRDSHRSRKDVEQIFRNQMPDDEKVKRADHVIYNDDTRMVLPQVLALHEKFIGKI